MQILENTFHITKSILLKMFFLLCFYFHNPISAQIFIGDSARVFVSENTNIYIIKDDSKCLTKQKISSKDSYAKYSILTSAKSRFSKLHKRKLKTSEISVEKEKTTKFSIVYKPQDNSTSFTPNSSNKQNLIVPSQNSSVFGIISKQAPVSFIFYKVLQHILYLEKFNSYKYRSYYPIRPPPSNI